METMMEKRKMTVSFLILSLAFLLLCIRCFYGFDWSDETYYLALPYRFVLGDQFFLHSWDIHQLSAMLLVPFVRLYTFIVGSTEGILLSFRLLYTVLQFIIAITAFSVFKKHFSIVASLLSSLSYLLFTPAQIQNFSYNTLSLSFLFLAILSFLSHKKGGFLFLSGIFFALAVQCYPFLVIFVPVIMVPLFFLFLRGCDKRKVVFSLLLFAGGCLLVLALLLCNLVMHSSFSALIHHLPYLITDPEHPSRGLLQPLYAYFFSYFSNYAFLLIISGASIASFLLLKQILPEGRRLLLRKLLFVIASALLLLEIFRAFFMKDIGVNRVHLFLIPFALTGPLFFLACKDFRHHFTPFLLWGSGILFSLAVSYGTNNGYSFFSFPFIFCTVAVILLISQIIPELFPNSIPLRAAFPLFLCCFIALIGTLRITIVYRDGPVSSLTAQLQHGPGAYLFTTQEQQQKYQSIIHAFSYLPEEGTVLFTKLLPFGYLATTAAPASPSIWRTPLESERLLQYYRLHPEKLPDCVFVVKDGYGITNEHNPLSVFFEEYLEDFEAINLDSATVYIKK
ncbi:hypothetical protein [Zongyangia hominis]|uniref:Glycosyltransferase RgtA/B/C/D-like domain-containing protein n=1 Tax=Zongyangia hominis TaxID=2763677 RepID=A0A926IB22_9FIRM|nr:hypothetical protein [Zongyangia hominis]MBC8569717.1 hypothetical protein [Zongyangia hominis]